MPTKPKAYHIEGIVLSKRDHGEKDQIFHILTTKNVKVSVLAKYAKVVPSRHNSGLDVFNVVQCQLHTGKFLPVVTQSRQIRNFSGIFARPESVELAYKVVMATSSLLPYEERSEQLYDRLLACLEHLATSDHTVSHRSVVFFLVRMLESLGFIETTQHCQQCRGELGERIIWESGRFLCFRCGKNEKTEKLSFSQLELLYRLVRSDFPQSADDLSHFPVILPLIERQIGQLAYYPFFEKSLFSLV